MTGWNRSDYPTYFIVMEGDAIDFGRDRVSTLFRRMFVPTLFGMLSICVVTLVDGVFVGHGVGSDGIAAVNICIPLLMLVTGLGLMLGVGSSVVASLHLSKDNDKAARINITQAFIVATLLTVIAGGAVMLFPGFTGRLLGSSETLLPMVRLYLLGMMPGMIFQMCDSIGLFALRLDGSPTLAMWVNVIGALANVVLDWIFIFPMQTGVFGAALASSLSMVIGTAIVIAYLGLYSRRLKFYRVKWSRKSLCLTMRNIGYQCRIGGSALLGEATMAVLMFMGNVMFMRYLGDAGVGAFGIACYYCPFIFMIGNAIAQSAQPIISYNAGSEPRRAKSVQRYALAVAVTLGVLLTLVFTLLPQWLVELFLPLTNRSAQLAVEGLPLFGLGLTFFILNLVIIGYYQSIEKSLRATLIALLRGAIFLIPLFVLLPLWLGAKGIWLAMPVSEFITLFCSIILFLKNR